MEHTKTIVKLNGIIGLIGGIFLQFGGLFVLAGATQDEATVTAVTSFFLMIKLLILILGVTALIYYKNSDVSVIAPNVLLVIGGVISIIPFLGWIGGILIIIGGALNLSKIKYFN